MPNICSKVAYITTMLFSGEKRRGMRTNTCFGNMFVSLKAMETFVKNDVLCLAIILSIFTYP